MMANTTSSHGSGSLGHSTASENFHTDLAIYVGVIIAVGIAVCVAVIVIIFLYKHGKCRRLGKRRDSLRRLFVRGFSTVSQRGVIDSTAEFEIINTSVTTSVSSDTSARSPGGAKSAPKKPDRRRTRTSSSNVKYENVTLDTNAGFVVRKSISMGSGIPYMDSTLDGRLKDDEENDDVFE